MRISSSTKIYSGGRTRVFER